MSAHLVVGIFGVGVVGGGVVDLISRQGLAEGIKLKAAVVRDTTKTRSQVNFPLGCKLSTNADDILEDEEINCVIEVMGGTTTAWDITRKAMQKGKHVITANKALMSKYMCSIENLLRANPKLHFMYEAAVCGGIPTINTIKRSFPWDDILSVSGILNGTTNFILTNMYHKGLDYSEMLKQAQDNGYAESDPSADVDGFDARSKLCILTKLCFGLTIDESQVFCKGISGITQIDFEYAKMIKHTIKLLGIAEKVNSGVPNETDRIHMCVTPVLVPLEDPILANTDFSTNIVSIKSRHTGQTILIGPGAGRGPTANSITADLFDLSNRVRCSPNDNAPNSFSAKCSNFKLDPDFTSAFYIRIVVDDNVGIIEGISGCLARHSVSINSILQNPITNPRKVPFVIITEFCKLSQVELFCKEVASNRGKGNKFNFVIEDPYFMKYSV